MRNKLKTIAKKIYLRAKFYRLFGNKSRSSSDKVLVFFIRNDYHKKHPGLVDRFKAIIGLYYIAKKNNRNFKLYYDTPFMLQKYLVPNKVNWIIDDGTWSNNLNETAIIEYSGTEASPIVKSNKKEIHCYYYLGHNILRENSIPNWKDLWAEMFHELFQPSKYLNELLASSIPRKKFISVHLRFVNALDAFEDDVSNELDETQKQKLIAECILALDKIRKSEKLPVYIFSDSDRFLQIAKDQGYHVLNGAENIGHITYTANERVYDKTFVDFFTMSSSEKVFSIRGDVLYNSVFPEYAAIVGKCDFNVITLK